ncbi:MAG: flavin reductase family protein [Chloroflexi bacterium]|nr:flavin reductase family protein [Chloroflexota bacterium]
MTARLAPDLVARTADANEDPSVASRRDWDVELFRQAFRRHASTVVLLTYFDTNNEPCGMTATSVCSLSASPPSLLACINREARAFAEITKRRRFGVNLLSVAQSPIARHCSRAGLDKRLLAGWLTDSDVGGTPRLDRALAHLECRLETSLELFSHSVLVGVVDSVWLNPEDAPPLLYHGGLYNQLESPAERAERYHWQAGS